jgi:hypothetical protein
MGQWITIAGKIDREGEWRRGCSGARRRAQEMPSNAKGEEQCQGAALGGGHPPRSR